MAIRLDEIEGLMVEKKITSSYCTVECMCMGCMANKEFNAALDLQGSKEIGLNREKLADILRTSCSVDDDCYYCRKAKAYADAIISQEHNLIELKGRDK